MKQRLSVRTFGRQYRRAVLMLAVLCTSLWVGAQGFEKKIGGPKDDFGQAILQTKDHGYIEVGSTRGVLGDDNDFDIFVVRTDVDGTTVWTRQFDEGFDEQAEDILAVDDGAYLIAGYRTATATSSEQTYLLKLDRFGNVVFSRAYGEEGTDERSRQLTALPNGDALLTGYRKLPATDRREMLVTRVDAAGEVVFRTSIGEAFSSEAYGTVVTPSGGLIVAGNRKATADAAGQIVLHGLTAGGALEWTRVYGDEASNDRLEGVTLTDDGHLVFVGSSGNANRALIAKTDLNGDTLWYRSIDAGPFDDVLYSVVEEATDGSLVAVGQTVPTPANLDVLMVKVDAATGNLIWLRRLGDDVTLDVGEDLAATRDGGFALAGFSARFDGVLGNEMVLFKTDDLGALQTNYLMGRVYHPTGDDCRPFAEGDLGLAGWLVVAESETATFYGSTDSLGNYELRVDAGVYGVSLLPKNDRWAQCDPLPTVVELPESYDTSFQDFSLLPAFDCPLLEVSLSATPAVQCDTQRLTLHYANSGSATATGTSVELLLDENLTFLTASQAFTEDNDMLVFATGDLAPSTEGTIELTVLVGCNGVTAGQAIRSRATIFPLIDCAPVSADWDGSSIVVTSRCDREEGLSFTITNIGDDMTQSSSYVIVEDIMLREQNTFQLAAEGFLEIPVDVSSEDGEVGTFRLIAEQAEGHPGSQFPTAVAEGCLPQTGAVTFSTGFVAQFPDNDGDLYLDILTQEIVVLDEDASVQLTAYPRGYLDEIIIPKTDIEYTVFFELPPNDSFERVVIRDTLPEALDLNSLVMGAASHPYDYVLYQDGILKITFDSIRIFSGGGTGEADAVTRTGYATYRLSQKPNTTTGTVIRNRAAVYFDYQTPVRSEEVRHTVGCADLLDEDGCLLTGARDLPLAPGVDIIISPNPVGPSTTVELRGWTDQRTELTLQLFDAAGRRVYRTTFRGDFFELQRPNVAAGAYFYEVAGAGQLLGSGQITFQ